MATKWSGVHDFIILKQFNILKDKCLIAHMMFKEIGVVNIIRSYQFNLIQLQT